MLEYSEAVPQLSLRYLEFGAFDERVFLEAFAEYLQTVFYTTNIQITDTCRRRAPDGQLRYAYQILVNNQPFFDVVSDTHRTCFIGVSKGQRESVYSPDAILEAFIGTYQMSP